MQPEVCWRTSGEWCDTAPFRCARTTASGSQEAKNITVTETAQRFLQQRTELACRVATSNGGLLNPKGGMLPAESRHMEAPSWRLGLSWKVHMLAAEMVGGWLGLLLQRFTQGSPDANEVGFCCCCCLGGRLEAVRLA